MRRRKKEFFHVSSAPYLVLLLREKKICSICEAKHVIAWLIDFYTSFPTYFHNIPYIPLALRLTDSLLFLYLKILLLLFFVCIALYFLETNTNNNSKNQKQQNQSMIKYKKTKQRVWASRLLFLLSFRDISRKSFRVL